MRRMWTVVGLLAVVAIAGFFIYPYVLPAVLPEDGTYEDRAWETGEDVRLVAVGGMVDGKVMFRLYYQDLSMSPLDDVAVPCDTEFGPPSFVAQLFHDEMIGNNLLAAGTIRSDYFVDNPLWVFSQNGMVHEAQAVGTYDHYILRMSAEDGAGQVVLIVEVGA